MFNRISFVVTNSPNLGESIVFSLFLNFSIYDEMLKCIIKNFLARALYFSEIFHVIVKNFFIRVFMKIIPALFTLNLIYSLKNK